MTPAQIKEVHHVIAMSIRGGSIPKIRKMLRDLLVEREVLLAACRQLLQSFPVGAAMEHAFTLANAEAAVRRAESDADAPQAEA